MGSSLAPPLQRTKLKVLGMSMARGQAYGTTSATIILEDVKLLKEMGMDAYRFSISWSRILPKGTLEGGINYKGLQYYENLINTLKENGENSI